MIKVVFIDIDNTILSFSGYVKEAMREGFPAFGLKPYTDDMFPVFEETNDALWRRLEQGTLTLEELIGCRWDMIFEKLGIDFDGKVFEEYFRKKLFYSAVPEEGAADLLDYLSRKYTLCAASNGPCEQQMNRLKLGKMLDYFSFCFISSAVGAQKPGKAFFDHCFKTLRESGFPALKPEEAMIIGDSPSSDISGGRDYGMRTCLYKKGITPGRGVYGADHVVGRLADIKNIL
ncbi:MAG: HAD-IA family hydrolase [Clostridia bacterium]|nr:HAD-IA family hydrolase [Clostridia bacterium]